MGGLPANPHWLVGAGVVLLVSGYATLAAIPNISRLVAGPARLVFYAGLAAFLTGVVLWLRQPPRPGPAEEHDDESSSLD
jgi:hypothetical protein